MSNSDSFFDRVYETVRKIPAGKVCTYGLIAKHIGSPKAAKMVGWAMNGLFSKDGFVPAHRVVNRIGVLTGKNHFNPPEMMQELLESEGVKVKNDKIINFEKYLWIPT